MSVGREDELLLRFQWVMYMQIPADHKSTMSFDFGATNKF